MNDTDTEKLVAALRTTLAEHVWDGTVLDLSAYTDERIIEVAAMHRAIGRVRRLLEDLAAPKTMVTFDEAITPEQARAFERRRRNPSDLIT